MLSLMLIILTLRSAAETLTPNTPRGITMGRETEWGEEGELKGQLPRLEPLSSTLAKDNPHKEKTI